MFDPGALNITSWVVLAEVVLILRYLCKRLNLRLGWLPMGGAELLLVALAWCMLTSFFLIDFRAYEGGVIGSLSKAVLAGSLALGLICSLFHPVAAVCLFVSLLFLRPWELISGSIVMTALPKLMAAICVLSWVSLTIRRKQFMLYFDKSCAFFASFVLWLFLSALASGDMQAGVDYHIELFIPILVTCFLVVNSSSESTDLEVVRSTIIVSTLGVILTALYLSYGTGEASADTRLHGAAFLGNANDLAALIMVALPLLVIPYLRGRWSFYSSIWVFAASGVLLFGLWCSQSRGGMLSLAAAGVSYFVLYLRKLRQGGVAVLLLGVLAFALYSNIERDEGDMEMSSVSRWNYVIAGLGMAKDYPILGVGIGNYPKMYEMYTPSFDEWGSRTAHSTWILILAESGFVGFGLFALLYFSVLRLSWKERKAHPEFLVSFISYSVAMTFLSHSYLFLPYLLFALILSSRSLRVRGQIARRTSAEKQKGYHSFVGAKGMVSVVILTIFSVALFGPRAAYAQVSFQGIAGVNKPIGDFSPSVKPLVELSGSRGEILSFLVKASVAPQFAKGLICGRMSLSAKESTQTPHLEVSRLATITTEHPSFPGAYVGEHLDPAIPQPLSKVCIHGEKTTWLVGELAIPRDMPTGEHRYLLSWDKNDSAKLEIGLSIWGMEMPDRPALPAYMEMTTWWNLLGHYGEWRSGEGRLSEKYFQEMKNHRILPITAHVRVPEIEMKGGKAVLDLKNRPTSDDSFFAVNLKNRPSWAHFGFPTIVPEKIADPSTAKYFDALHNTLGSLKEFGQPMIYLWDEPSEDVIPEVKKLASIVKKHAPGLKVMVTTPFKKSLEDVVDIFVPVMDQYGDAGFPGYDTYRKLQTEKGKEVWWYVSCMSHGCEALVDSGRPDFVLDRPSVYIRSISWLSMKYKLDAFLYFSVNHGYQYYPKRDPWESIWDFSGNGDGTLFYPGRPGKFGIERELAVPSLRLKAWREASFDAEYIRWMNKLDSPPAWWKTSFETLTQSTKSWSREYDKYAALRKRAGDYLNAHLEELR